MESDPILRLRDEWRRELPDLETDAMVVVARVNRTRALLMREVEAALVDAGATIADFDVLATLRRQGAPYRMRPSTLGRSIMLSASGVTSRVDHLERAGLVARVHDPTNRRTAPVELTEAGVVEAERLVREMVRTEERITTSLSARERESLDAILIKLEAGVDARS